MAAAVAGSQLIDSKVGKPPNFSGNEVDWKEWAFVFRAYAGLMSVTMADLMVAVEAQ